MQNAKEQLYVADVNRLLEHWAPPELQESYDNSGLLVGDARMPVSGILVSLDLTEAVIDEAMARGCNLIVSHHPIIFGKLKRLVGTDYVQRAVMKAIKNDVALYALHTNLDNIRQGVSAHMAEALGLQNCSVLAPKHDLLAKLVTFVPEASASGVRQALFEAGAGWLGNYSHASFNSQGTGTFRPEEGSNPYSGVPGKIQYEPEIKVEVLFERWKQQRIVHALKQAHPYEEVAYDLLPLGNASAEYGSGIVGDLLKPMAELELLQHIKKCFGGMIRYTALLGKPITRVALCGGSGSFLLPNALQAGAQLLLTADFKYHQFFDADNRIVIADIGHYESEQFTKDLIANYLSKKITTFAVLISETTTNPVNYL
ncbi:MAG: Nif3-like dinuclear metal center hexameric protein [Bacteroidia bacterium]